MDGSITEEKIEKIQSFAENAYATETIYKEEASLTSEAIQSYSRKLDETLQSLQDHVKRQEDALQKLRESQRDSDFPGRVVSGQARLGQTRRAKNAYASLLQAEPELPAPDSPLTGLIALRETSRVLAESKAAIQSLKTGLTADRQRLRLEEDNLRDANLITQGLETRIERMRTEKSERADKDTVQLAKDMIQSERKKNKALERDAAQVKLALHQFVDEHLAAMLAAEDLGGPIVGDSMDVSDSTLEAGYTSHGKPKKPKATAGDDEADPTQQRIDVLLRRRRDEADDSNVAGPTNRRQAAAAAMHSLLDALLEAGPAYIDVPREAAVSRFLVRAKIAQLHPRDARRMRLIDFGRTLDD